jgi:sugar diacid utilization regulator
LDNAFKSHRDRRAEIRTAPLGHAAGLGFLVVADPAGVTTKVDRGLVQQASLALTLALMQSYESFLTESRLKSDVLHQLFSENRHKDAEIIGRASYLGIDLKVPNVMLLLRVGGPGEDFQATTEALDRLLPLVSRSLAGRFRSAVAVVDAGAIVILAPTLKKSAEFALALATTVSSVITQAVAGVPPPLRTCSGEPALYPLPN